MCREATRHFNGLGGTRYQVLRENIHELCKVYKVKPGPTNYPKQPKTTQNNPKQPKTTYLRLRKTTYHLTKYTMKIFFSKKIKTFPRKIPNNSKYPKTTQNKPKTTRNNPKQTQNKPKTTRNNPKQTQNKPKTTYT